MAKGRLYSHKAARRVREQACRCAALALSGRQEGESLVPLAWSLTVFFETYIWKGAEGTRKDFGPKKPPKLRVIGQ